MDTTDVTYSDAAVVDSAVAGPHGAVPIRTYTPTRPAAPVGLVWLHGGAFWAGDLDMPESDWVARQLARLGVCVVAVDYRLAVNGVHFPVPVDDVLAVWHARDHVVPELPGIRWSIGGASAGACLAASAAVRLRETPQQSPHRLVLVYPVVHPEIPLDAEHVARMDRLNPEPRFSADDVRQMSINYAGAAVSLHDPAMFPGNGPLTGLPPTLIVNADHDDLRPSGEKFGAQLHAAGVVVSVDLVPGSRHGFLNNSDGTALPTIQDIARWVSQLEGPKAQRELTARHIHPLPATSRTLMTNSDHMVSDLIGRSNRLGADPRNTNYAGGNTSAKGTATDPVTGEPVELLWVKGSGGDLGTLTPANLAVVRLDRLRALVDVYPGVDHEDEMVAAFDYCLHGKGGAAPSIDTAMHGLVDAAHVDHLHPDSGIALATAADGAELTRKAFGDRVAWVPWRRPGFQLGLDISAIQAANPQAIGVILGGHGITAWGDTSAEAEANSLEIIRTAEAFLAENGSAEPFGPAVPGYEALPEFERRAKAAALFPTLRGLASTDKLQLGHFTDSDVVLDFLSRDKLGALAELGTSCPDHFLRTKVKPMVVNLPSTASVAEILAALPALHEAYRADYAGYYQRHATPDSPAMRGADPAIVLVPGVGMFSFGKDKQTARVAGEFYVNAINVMRGAESVSTYAPISEAEKFAIEYWALEEAKLARMPKPKALATRVALVTGAGSGIGRAIATRVAAEGGCVVIADLNLNNAEQVAAELGGSDVAIAIRSDVSDEESVAAAFAAASLAFGGVDLVVNNAGLSLSKPLLETTVKDWDLQHNVMAKGSFLVSREAAKVMIAQQLGGDIIYISSKNSVFAGPNNIAYSATKADQAHQVRLLAAELGQYGIRVNGINPDGVVRGSGIFASGWGASRAAVYGVKEEDLGAYYAKRTLLGKEVLPDHIGDAVYALAAGDLSQTTGLHIPVDSGVAAAFLR